jgi:hypothetical protein
MEKSTHNITNSQEIKTIERTLNDFKALGVQNAKELSEIKTKLYLGDYKGKRLNFYANYARNNIECSSNIDLELVGRDFNNFSTYSTGRTKSYIGNYPTTRKGDSNISKMTLAYLSAFKHICTFRKVGHVKGNPSKNLTRELMYLTMPEVECNNENSKMFAVSWSTVIKAWELKSDSQYHDYKSYFNACVDTALHEMKDGGIEVKKNNVLISVEN